MFDAYNATPPNAGLTWDGKPVPTWEKLNDQVRGKWVGAALEATRHLGTSGVIVPPPPTGHE